jgi:hypothetical protein
MQGLLSNVYRKLSEISGSKLAGTVRRFSVIERKSSIGTFRKHTEKTTERSGKFAAGNFRHMKEKFLTVYI